LIDRVDPSNTISAADNNNHAVENEGVSIGRGGALVQALAPDGLPVVLPIANGATLRGGLDTVGAGMAMILDVFLSKGYEPDGFEQCDGFRVYRYKPFGGPAASPPT
jgi:hypothetical protein